MYKLLTSHFICVANLSAFSASETPGQKLDNVTDTAKDKYQETKEKAKEKVDEDKEKLRDELK